VLTLSKHAEGSGSAEGRRRRGEHAPSPAAITAGRLRLAPEPYALLKFV